MPQFLEHHQLSNGLVVVIEQMPDVQSASMACLVPAGVIHEPRGANGTSAALCDLMTRGAGERDSRTLSQAFDRLGVQRSEHVGWNFIALQAAMLADHLEQVLPLYADILLRARLPERELPAVLAGVEQTLRGIEDEPQRRVITELHRRCYADPWGRPSEGNLAELDHITHAGLAHLYREGVRPNGTIIGIAGNVDPQRVLQTIEELLGTWEVRAEDHVEPTDFLSGTYHLPAPSTQTHIGLAFPGVPYGHPDYYSAWAAVSVLSGGSSSRLFTEVREKRGLCYSVYATLNSLKDRGSILVYAGTTVDRAQETLDCCLREIHRLTEGIEPAELARCRARAKSSLVMQQESTMSRANSIARDWFHLGRIVTLDEVHQKIEAVTIEDVLSYVRRYPPRQWTLLTVGQEPLNLSVAEFQ